MPNPVSMVIPAPSASAKPAAPTPEPSGPANETTFQSVMDLEEGDLPAGVAAEDLHIQEPELLPDSEGDEVPEPSTVLEEHVPAGQANSTSDEDHRIAIGGWDQSHPVLPESPREAGNPPLNAEPEWPHPMGFIPQNTTDLQVTTTTPPYAATPPLLTGSPEIIFKSLDNQVTPAPAVSHSRTTPAPLEQLVWARDLPQQPSVVTPTPAQTASPDRSLTPMLVQTTEQIGIQAEFTLPSEIDEAPAVRDAPTLPTGRDLGPATLSQTATARAEVARAVAAQMAAVVSSGPQNGSIEIALNPEELGRVSIVLNGRDDGLQMTIAAERPETLDMMRRHLAVLEAEFQSLGLGNLSFDLGTSSHTQRDESAQQGESAPDSHPQPEHASNTSQAVANLGSDGRIDMRL